MTAANDGECLPKTNYTKLIGKIALKILTGIFSYPDIFPPKTSPSRSEVLTFQETNMAWSLMGGFYLIALICGFIYLLKALKDLYDAIMDVYEIVQGYFED